MRNAYLVSKNSCTFARMFERLQTKWKVKGSAFFLILCVFALGGSLTGYLGKMIMNWLPFERGWGWTLVYIIIVTLIWPINVLLVSIPFGQFKFFTEYLRRMGSTLGIGRKNTEDSKGLKEKSNTLPVNIAIFASGTGTNAKNLMDYFGTSLSVTEIQNEKQVAIVKLVVCNKPDAGALQFAKQESVATLFIEKEKFFRGNGYVDELKAAQIDFIVLAGFLWKIPQQLIVAYRNRIINIHPALLPKYGGKGMYGSTVHEAVINSGEKESGITIHYVDEHYDNGDIIFQARIGISDHETSESLAQKIHQLEYTHYPRVLKQLILEPNGS